MVGALLAAVLSSVAIGVVTHIWDQPLHVPFQYAHAPGDDEEDATLDLMLIKNVHETGWFNHNPKLNAPFEQQWAEWPMGGDLLAYTIKKGIVEVTNDVPLTFNLFWLLTFPMTAFVAFPALRSLRTSWSAALVGAVLFSLAPYHFRNGAGHENLAFYVGVPTIVLLCMKVLGPDSALPGLADLRHRHGWWRIRGLLAGVVLIGVTGIYYLAFLLCLVGMCAVIGTIARRRPGRLLLALGVGVIGLATSFLANLPTLLFRWSHATNLLGVPDRRPGISEAYPLRIVELLSPVTQHRFGPFAWLADQLYAPKQRGFGTAMLGLAGSIGLVVAIAAVVMCAARRSRTRGWVFEARVGIVIVVALVIGTGGGFSRAFELTGLSGVRAWSRIAIVIAFASIVVFARLLDRVRVALTRTRSRPLPRLAVPVALGLVVMFGVIDQASPALIPKPREAAWRADGRFVADLEHRLPHNAMVFQLPVVDFPEHGGVADMSAHDLIKQGYLHSTSLRWSAGGIRGRSGEWQWPAAKLRTSTLVRGLSALGFAAVMVDRQGFADDGAHRVAAMNHLLGPPIVRGGDRLVAWSLRGARRALQARSSVSDLRGIARRLLHAPRLYLSTDVDPIRNRGATQSVCRSADLVFVNPSRHSRPATLRLDLTPSGAIESHGRLRFHGRSIPIVVGGRVAAVTRRPSKQSVRLVLPPGETHAELQLKPHGVRCASVQFDQLTTVSVSLIPSDRS